MKFYTTTKFANIEALNITQDSLRFFFQAFIRYVYMLCEPQIYM